MSEQTPYQKLEVSEDASFEEIQSARDRLIELQGDEQARQSVEAAYDAVLMDRLRRRQTGAIQVPERIRFAEKLAKDKPSVTLPTLSSSPDWLVRLLDRPSGRELATASGVWVALGSLVYLGRDSQDSLALLIALGVGFNIYWLNRKELKLGRAVLITIVTLVLGGALGVGLLQFGLPLTLFSPDLVVALVVFILFWGASNFLR
ncbi:CPP1-like family protein [Lyngbya confervoides]|uniref:CPP1-like family protein n=1 Tax=Lyngbya confervoides BDU141951 TaxID=1574623 RepID=A0ABD4T161_9CYAN|nr:CPP1-like family protein [Lyngbya confervoides]MCM1982105.1 CPP1-like family protein [Lyngbya confervoides BDU141951]